MVKVLQINAGSENFGGVSAMLLNIYRNIDREKVQFDFLTPNKTTYAIYKSEIEAMGGKVYELGINSSTLGGKVKLSAGLKNFLRDKNYDVIHINSGVLLFNCFAANACRRYSTAKIIVHSHNAGGRTKWKERISEPLKKYLESKSDALLACSSSAAAYIFTPNSAKKAAIIKNGIDIGKFSYDAAVREEVRRELKLTDEFVVGCVGRFMPQKNHALLMEVFSEIVKWKPNAVLLLIGQGELMPDVQEQVQKADLSDKVLFLGQRKDVNRLYQAMDVFTLTSRYEGLSVVSIEAQTAGLPCIVSRAVPEEAHVTDNIRFMRLTDPPELWAQAIIEAGNTPRRDTSPLIRKQGYDIKATAEELEAIYLNLARN